MIKHFLKQVRKSIIICVEKELKKSIMPMKSFVKKNERAKILVENKRMHELKAVNPQ